MKMKTGRTYQLVAQRWQSPSGLFHIKRESCIAHSFTQRISSCSSVTCQAWGNFFAQSSSLFFTAPLWALLWWSVPSPLSLDRSCLTILTSQHLNKNHKIFISDIRNFPSVPNYKDKTSQNLYVPINRNSPGKKFSSLRKVNPRLY